MLTISNSQVTVTREYRMKMVKCSPIPCYYSVKLVLQLLHMLHSEVMMPIYNTITKWNYCGGGRMQQGGIWFFIIN